MSYFRLRRRQRISRNSHLIHSTEQRRRRRGNNTQGAMNNQLQCNQMSLAMNHYCAQCSRPLLLGCSILANCDSQLANASHKSRAPSQRAGRRTWQIAKASLGRRVFSLSFSQVAWLIPPSRAYCGTSQSGGDCQPRFPAVDIDRPNGANLREASTFSSSIDLLSN